MEPNRRTALLAGALYLITIVASITARGLVDPVLSDPDYILGPGPDVAVAWGGVLELVNAAACVGTAIVLFPVIRRYGESAALGFVAARTVEAAVIVVTVVSYLTIVTLRTDGATGTDATMLDVTGRALVGVHDWSFLLSQGTIPGFNALLLGTLLYRSGLVPRIIPAIGLAGAPLLLAGVVAVMVGAVDQVSAWTVVATVPIFVWEASLGVWLVVKGFSGATRDPAVAAAAGSSR